MTRGAWPVGLALGVLAAAAGCATHQADYSWVDGTNARDAGSSTMRVRWTYDLVPELEGASIPVQGSTAAFDLPAKRVFVGAAEGSVWALGLDGRRLYKRKVEEGIEAPPVLDDAGTEVYLASVAGTLYALKKDDGSELWHVPAGGPVSSAPLLTEDALYVATDTDHVIALARSNGEVLWRYKRDPTEGFAIAGHAGLSRDGRRIFAGFSDGAVVALDASDGHVLWQIDTSEDLIDLEENSKRFRDVDTTPVIVEDRIYVASFSGGLYALDAATGTLRMRNESLIGITAIQKARDALILSSADLGLICLDVPGDTPRWIHPIERGSAGQPAVAGETIYVAESLGALLAVSLADGREIGRVESAQGFTGQPSLAAGHGFILSNAGRVYAFSY
jgi:outer membrane protein assembly factor BamB